MPLNYPLPVNPTIDLSELTHAVTDGYGVFDVLMKAVKGHLQQEYDNGRLKGTEYATVYLGALESTLSTSLQFLLNRDKINNEVALIKKQINLADSQLAKLSSEKNLIDQQQLSEVAKTSLITNQAQAESYRINGNAPVEGQLHYEKEVAKNTSTRIGSEQFLIDQQKLTEVNKTILAGNQGEIAQYERNMLKARIDGLDIGLGSHLYYETAVLKGQSELLDQKIANEVARRDPSAVIAGSIIDKEAAVLAAQANGFIRDAEQKAAKILVDTFNVGLTSGATVVAADANLNEASIGAVVAKLKEGIGII